MERNRKLFKVNLIGLKKFLINYNSKVPTYYIYFLLHPVK